MIRWPNLNPTLWNNLQELYLNLLNKFMGIRINLCDWKHASHLGGVAIYDKFNNIEFTR